MSIFQELISFKNDFIHLSSILLRMLYRCTTKLPQGIKNFIRKCKVDTAGRLIKYHFDGYDCSARASATRNIYKASPLISDDRNVALASNFYGFSTQTTSIFMDFWSFYLLLFVMSTKCISLYDTLLLQKSTTIIPRNSFCRIQFQKSCESFIQSDYSLYYSLRSNQLSFDLF